MLLKEGGSATGSAAAHNSRSDSGYEGGGRPSKHESWGSSQELGRVQPDLCNVTWRSNSGHFLISPHLECPGFLPSLSASRPGLHLLWQSPHLFHRATRSR